jgi:hypothetical protein
MFLLCLALLILAILGLVIYFATREPEEINNYNDIRSTTSKDYIRTNTVVYTEPEILYEDPVDDIIGDVILAEVEEEIIESANDSYDFDDSDNSDNDY